MELLQWVALDAAGKASPEIAFGANAGEDEFLQRRRAQYENRHALEHSRPLTRGVIGEGVKGVRTVLEERRVRVGKDEVEAKGWATYKLDVANVQAGEPGVVLQRSQAGRCVPVWGKRE